MGIVVIGAVFVDIKGYPLSTYIPGGRNAGRVEQVHGGVSRNVAEDIANVELRPTFVGLVDDTGMGLDVIEKLNNHKVNTRFIQRVPDGMGTWLAIFNNDGDVCAAISKRPDTTPLIGLLEEQGDEIFRDCDSIALELDLEKKTVKQTLRYAKKYGKKVYAVVSNMSIAMERRDFLQQIDCFVCNQQFAQRKNKVSFQGKRVVLLGVVGVDIHGVNELGAVWRDFNDLTFQPVHQRRVIGWVSGVTTAFPPKNRT